MLTIADFEDDDAATSEAEPVTNGGAESPAPAAEGAVDTVTPGETKVETAVEPGEPEKKQEAAPEVKPETRPLIVDGKAVGDREYTIDELQRLAQRGIAADRKFEDAAAVVKALKEDPIGVLARLGHDVDKLTDEYLEKRLNLQSMTPEQRRLHDLERQNAENEAKLRAMQEADEKKRMEVMQQSAAERLTSDFTAALDAIKIPVTEQAVQGMASYMLEARRQGTPITASQAAELVRDDFRQLRDRMLSGMTAEEMASVLGEERLQEINRRAIERVRGSGKAKPIPSIQGPRKGRTEPEKISVDDWKAGLLAEFGGT